MTETQTHTHTEKKSNIGPESQTQTDRHTDTNRNSGKNSPTYIPTLCTQRSNSLSLDDSKEEKQKNENNCLVYACVLLHNIIMIRTSEQVKRKSHT